MSYYRVLYLAASAGIGGFLYHSIISKQSKSFKDNPPLKQDYKNYINTYIRALYSVKKSQIREYFYKSCTDGKWLSNIFNVNAQPRSDGFDSDASSVSDPDICSYFSQSGYSDFDDSDYLDLNTSRYLETDSDTISGYSETDSGNYFETDSDVSGYLEINSDISTYLESDSEESIYPGSNSEGNRYSGSNSEGNRYSGSNSEGNRYSGSDSEGIRHSGSDSEESRCSGSEESRSVDSYNSRYSDSDQSYSSDSCKGDISDAFKISRVVSIDVIRAAGCTPKYDQNIAISYPHSFFPSRIVIKFRDYIIYADSQTKTRCWTVQTIKNSNVSQIEHEHCEINRVLTDQPDDYEYGPNDRLVAVSIITAKARKIQGMIVGCCYCNFLPIWKVFHQYIKFLSCFYDEVHVCSGLLYTNKKEYLKHYASHFFKIILCRNPDGTFRFECYKFKNQKVGYECKIPNLRDYLVSREELEKDIGTTMFYTVRDFKIKNRDTHLSFTPEWLKSIRKSETDENVFDRMYGNDVPVRRVDNLFELNDPCGSTTPIINHPSVASRSIARYQDYNIHIDSRTRTTCWTEQTVRWNNIAQVQHCHCEIVKIKYKDDECDERLDVRFITPPAKPCRNEKNELICVHCQYSSFWNLFHWYTAFLTERYCSINVISGALYSPYEDDIEDKASRIETHYFKAIKCANDDGTFRLECYIIPNERMCQPWYNLNDYLSNRYELQERCGFLVFDDVKDNQIRQCQPHSDFTTHQCSQN